MSENSRTSQPFAAASNASATVSTQQCAIVDPLAPDLPTEARGNREPSLPRAENRGNVRAKSEKSARSLHSEKKRQSARRRRRCKKRKTRSDINAETTNQSLHERKDNQRSQREQGSETASKSNRTVSKVQCEFTALAKSAPNARSYLKQALRLMMKQHQLICFGFHGSAFSKRFVDFQFIESMNKNTVTQMKNRLHLCMSDCKNEKEKVVVSYDLGQNGNQLCVLSTPLCQGSDIDGDVNGVAAFAFIATDQHQITARQAELTCDFLLAMSHLPVEATQETTSSENEPNRELAATNHLGRIGSSKEFAFKLVHELVNRFDCQQVALGIVSKNVVKMFAVSGLDSFKANSPGIVEIQQAMDECYDIGDVIVAQTGKEKCSHRSMPLHESWAQSTRSSVCSIPLLAGDECVAVLSMERNTRNGFGDDDIKQISLSVDSIGPAFDMAVRGDRSLFSHCKETMFERLKAESVFGKFVRVLALISLLYFCFGKMPYRPATKCELVPAGVSQTTAPFDAKLLQCNVRSGDPVKKGQLLARLDSKQLELEKESLVSRIEQLKTDVRKALGEGDVAAAHLAKASASALEHELTTVTTKIELCSILAPADGIVIEADLEQKIGQVFPQGERILTFSPMKNWEVKLEVPESLARYIQTGHQGSFRLNAWPNQAFEYQIENISAGAELVDGENIFIARAKVGETPQFFRQGMEGIAKTDASWHPVYWVTFRDAYEYLHQNFWF